MKTLFDIVKEALVGKQIVLDKYDFFSNDFSNPSVQFWLPDSDQSKVKSNRKFSYAGRVYVDIIDLEVDCDEWEGDNWSIKISYRNEFFLIDIKPFDKLQIVEKIN